MRELYDRLARARDAVDARHQFHLDTRGVPVCLCGFVGSTRQRTQTEHITTEVIAVFKAMESDR